MDAAQQPGDRGDDAEDRRSVQPKNGARRPPGARALRSERGLDADREDAPPGRGSEHPRHPGRAGSMSAPEFTTILEPELWHHVDRILQRVPDDIDVLSHRTDAELIDALGHRGAFDALRAYQAALSRWFAGLVFQAIRTAAIRPRVPRPAPPPIDDAEWKRMFEVPWREKKKGRSRCSTSET